MRRQFPTVEELRSMKITTLQGVLTDSIGGVTSPEEERILQQVINEKMLGGNINVNIDFRVGIATDSIGTDSIQSPEDEARAQAIIDKRVAEFKERMKSQAAQVPFAQIEAPLEVPKEVPVQEAPIEIQARFCQFCTSKGGRHMKACTRAV